LRGVPGGRKLGASGACRWRLIYRRQRPSLTQWRAQPDRIPQLNQEFEGMSDQVLHVGDSDFEAQVLKSDTPVLVDFWAEWCGPCKMIGPMVDELAGTYAGKVKVVKINIDHNPQTPRQYAVRGIPTLMLFKDGKVHSTQVGAVGKAQLAQFMDKAL